MAIDQQPDRYIGSQLVEYLEFLADDLPQARAIRIKQGTCWSFLSRGLFREQRRMPMSETPHVDETSEPTDIGKAEVSGPAGADTIPNTIKELLSDLPLLPHENEDRFVELFESFRSYAEPENIIY
jgi:hypothetical protein